MNPGHFCFGPKPNAPPLSPLSNLPGIFGGLVRVGDCAEVYAGWDHTEVWGDDPSTYHYATLVYAHFHVHADNIDLEDYRRRRHCHGHLRGELPQSLRPPPPPSPPSPPSPGHHQVDYESTPSLGDIAAWIGYHRNLPKAFVITRKTSWLFCKWEVPGHGKGGIECPVDTIMPWITECESRCHEPITALVGTELWYEIAAHGFAIYTRKLHNNREPGVDGVYHIWDGTANVH